MNQSLRWKKFISWWNDNFMTLRFNKEISKDELLSLIDEKITDIKVNGVLNKYNKGHQIK